MGVHRFCYQTTLLSQPVQPNLTISITYILTERESGLVAKIVNLGVQVAPFTLTEEGKWVRVVA